MAGAATVEFAIFRLSSGQAGELSFFEERAASASKIDGLAGQYAGFKLEEPIVGVHVTIWRSGTAYAAFAASATSAEGQAIPRPLLVEVLQADDIDRLIATLDAPCTEVFTGYGAAADGSFSTAVRTFRDHVDQPAPPAERAIGYHAAVVAETVRDLMAPAPAAGPAVRLMIGWTSREAHLAAKAKEGPIADNITLLRNGRQAADLYHVRFQEV